MEGETLGKTLFFFTVKFQINHKFLISNYLKLLFFFNLFIFFCSYTGYRVLLKLDLMSIIADGEEVIFEGEIPSEPSRIYELLMNAYSEQSKVVVKFFVDGVDALQAGSFPESFEKIEAESVTHHELTLRLSIESINQMSGFDKDFENYLRNVLSVPWSQVFKKMDELVSKMQPFADLLDNLGPYSQVYAPTWKEDYDELVKEQHTALTGILNSFEQANPAGLSDELSIRFIPVFRRALKLFHDKIIPELKIQTEQVGT